MQRLGVRLEVIEAVLGHVGGSRAGVVGIYQHHQFNLEARAASVIPGRVPNAVARADNREGGADAAGAVMQRTVRVEFTGPGETAREAWETVTAELAGKAGIADVGRFRSVLARGLADTQDYAVGGGMARADGRAGLVKMVETVAARNRIVELVDRLDAQLAGAAWPLDGPEADALRRALGCYRDRLGAIAWATKATRATKKPKAPATALVLVLAHHWQALTGEAP